MKNTVFTYALIASNVYTRKLISARLKGRGWNRIEIPFQNRPQFTGGFYATLYEHRGIGGNTTGNFVIAYRGTMLDFTHHFEQATSNVWDDIEFALLKEKPGYQSKAIKFYKSIKQFLSENYNSSYSLHLTGHSLGGVLAKIVSVKTGIPAVAFNAPGIGDSEDTHNKEIRILNINSKDGKLNKFGKQIGKIINIGVEAGEQDCHPSKTEKEAEVFLDPLRIMAADRYKSCVVEQHEMKNMIIALEQHLNIAGIRW